MVWCSLCFQSLDVSLFPGSCILTPPPPVSYAAPVLFCFSVRVTTLSLVLPWEHYLFYSHHAEEYPILRKTAFHLILYVFGLVANTRHTAIWSAQINSIRLMQMSSIKSKNRSRAQCATELLLQIAISQSSPSLCLECAVVQW